MKGQAMDWVKKTLGSWQAFFQFVISGSIVSALAMALLWSYLSPKIEARIQTEDAYQSHRTDSLLKIKADHDGVMTASMDSLRRAARFQKNYARFANPAAYARAVKESQDWQ